MKKIFLITTLLFQLTIVFGQKPIAEDEKVIQYSTNWGSWTPAATNSNILFSARLKWYDKKTKLYAWDVKWKVTRMPIAFEWKISNQVFTGASDTPEENDGYYTSSVFDSKDNSNSMNSSGFPIYSTSKTTLYYQVRNVCYEFDGRNPNCEETNNSNITKANQQNSKQNSKNNSSNSLSIEQLENIIIANLKRNLKTGSFDEEPANYGTTVIQKIDAIRDPSIYYGGDGEPNTLYIYHYTPGETKFFGDKFVNLEVEKKYYGGQNLLYFVSNDKSKTRGLFLYNFGTNDENFIELKNAIEALKNPNKSFGGSSKQSGNVEKIQENNTTKTKQTNASTSLTTEDGTRLINGIKTTPEEAVEIYKAVFNTIGYKHLNTEKNKYRANSYIIQLEDGFYIDIQANVKGVNGNYIGISNSDDDKLNSIINQLQIIRKNILVSKFGKAFQIKE